MDMAVIDKEENRRRMRDGELYYAFTSDLIIERQKCRRAYEKYNAAGEANRRALVGMWKEIIQDTSALPLSASTLEEDDAALQDWPWVESPIRMDYGYNIRLGKNVFVNHGSTWVDTCLITIGDRTLIGPNCSFFSGTHPLDPNVRNGTRGPETGKPIAIGEDCWFGGSCIVLPGVTIGRGVTVGAGSVVTRNVPAHVVVAGNPARVIKKLSVQKGDV